MLVNNNLHRPLEVVLEIPVRTYDIDFMGIVSNIVYIRWLEDLRLKFLDEHWQLNQQIEQGYAPVLAGTEIEYKRPIKIIDKVIGRLWLGNIGRLKWTVQAEILSNNKLAAVANQKGGFVSLQNNRLIPIPEELQKKYLQHQQGIQKN
ncbi:acyl-CoA thioesterase [Nostoc flagelliforme FACHB-838]|uniref:Acyl-CoA thioesterase n=1 Tax=Nostoc flagelliforme FACHB-838 TaxID=2692904 RepID=A0ABR8DLJ6_9NOSO|nr:thioesterase family protein [Nostoc flagelliforme]MBD2529811.1 acyl-CoA thioesterase [Nostoc flagelliforme FACHB-838]